MVDFEFRESIKSLLLERGINITESEDFNNAVIDAAMSYLDNDYDANGVIKATETFLDEYVEDPAILDGYNRSIRGKVTGAIKDYL